MIEKAKKTILCHASDAQMIRIWIEHWQDDVAAGLKPTETSLENVRNMAEALERSLKKIGLSGALTP